LEFKDAGEEVSFVNIEEGVGGKDVMTFICDKCENEHKNIVIAAATPPRAR